MKPHVFPGEDSTLCLALLFLPFRCLTRLRLSRQNVRPPLPLKNVTAPWLIALLQCHTKETPGDRKQSRLPSQDANLLREAPSARAEIHAAAGTEG